MESELLSLEEVLQQAEQLGLEVSERTFRYYAVLGLLPRPLKRPNTDARVHYYQPDILDRLSQIRNLQAQGHSLKQVKKHLEAAGQSKPALVRALAEGQFQQACQRFLTGPATREAAQTLVHELLTQTGQSAQSLATRDLESCVRQLCQWHRRQRPQSSDFCASQVAQSPALQALLEKTRQLDTQGLPLLGQAQARLASALADLAAGQQIELAEKTIGDIDRFLSGYAGLLDTPAEK